MLIFKNNRPMESNHLCLLSFHLLLQVGEHLVKLLAGVLGLRFSSQHLPRLGRGRVGVFIVMDMNAR